MSRIRQKLIDFAGLCPVIFLSYLAQFLHWPAIQALFYEKSCIQLYSSNKSIDCTNLTALHQIVPLQGLHNHLYLAMCLAETIPGLFISVLIGCFCDSWRFKPCMLLPLIGLLITNLNYIFQSLFMTWNPYWLVFGELLFGFTGGSASILSTLFAYTTRTVEKERRTRKLAMMEGCLALATAIGLFVSGWARNAFGFASLFTLVFAINLISFLYVLIVVQDVKAVDLDLLEVGSNEPNSNIPNVLLQIPRYFRTIFSVSIEHGKAKILIILALIAFVIRNFAYIGTMDIIFPFLLYRFGWSDKQFGMFSGIGFALDGFSTFVIYPLLHDKLRVSNALLAAFSVFCQIIYTGLLIIAHQEWLIYASILPGSFHRFSVIGLRSICTQLVGDSGQGRIFAFIALLQSLGGIASTSVYNPLYPKTLNFFDGTMFLVSITVFLPALFIFMYLHPKIKEFLNKEREESLLKNECVAESESCD